MKFTIHTLRPCRDGEEPTHAAGFGSYRESSIAVEAPTRDAALVAAREKARAGETPKAWSPEPTRSHGGRLGHRELGAEAIRCGRHACLHTDGRWLAFGPTGWSSDADDDNVVDAEIPKESAAMGNLPGDIRRALQAMEAAYGPAIATGIFLDNIGAQFNVRRVPGESDEAYRARMGEEMIKPAVAKMPAASELRHDAATGVISSAASFDYEGYAAEQEYASWRTPAPTRPAAKPAWHALSPDLARSTHQVDPDHGSALLPILREGKA